MYRFTYKCSLWKPDMANGHDTTKIKLNYTQMKALLKTQTYSTYGSIIEGKPETQLK